MSETGEDREGIQGKTIVLSGALTPARFRGTDTVLNIGCGTRAAQSLPPGVYLAMNCRIFPAGKVSKKCEARYFGWIESLTSK